MLFHSFFNIPNPCPVKTFLFTNDIAYLCIYLCYCMVFSIRVLVKPVVLVL